jgi:hypothetical protein
MSACDDALEVQNELLLNHHGALCREERAITTDDLERLLERARYADAALRRLREMLGFAASSRRENESSTPIATSWSPGSSEDSAVIDLDERRRNRAERSR